MAAGLRSNLTGGTPDSSLEMTNGCLIFGWNKDMLLCWPFAGNMEDLKFTLYTGLLPCSVLDCDEVRTVKGIPGSRVCTDLLSSSSPEAISPEKPGLDKSNPLANQASSTIELLVAQHNIKQSNVLRYFSCNF